jgi:hypothetical protein
MRRSVIPAVLLLAVTASGCSEQPTTYELPVRVDALASKSHSLTNYHAHATGDQEVPARDTQAQGQLKLQLSKDGSALEYKLIVANIENVVASHLHVAPAGVNGGVVAWLAGPFAAGGGRTDGVLAEGTITAANFVGPLATQPLSSLIAAIDEGKVYVNVHTNDGVAPANTGPGDFPGGEVRGQVE